jgi:hypothetical protein
LLAPDSPQRSHLPSVLRPEAAVPQTEQILFSGVASLSQSGLPSAAPYGASGVAEVDGVDGNTQGE